MTLRSDDEFAGHSDETQNSTAGKRPNWLVTDAPEAKIRWGRVIALLSAASCSYLLAGTILHWWLDVPFRLVVPAIGMIMFLAWTVVLIEFQRHVVLQGRWKFQFGLPSLLILTMLVALFVIVMVVEVRRSRQQFAANAETKKQLEAFVNGGLVSVNALDGSNIVCQITRKNFSDDELLQLIDLTTDSPARGSKISHLFLEQTSVTDRSIREIDRCPTLYLLALPSIALSDESIQAITSLRELEILLLDEKKVTPSQLDEIWNRLPSIRINGYLRK